ncbi:MFS transporter [Humibacter ginsenosidimutans]|uniref:MFS transporter n=1 Tax=Humibacter ginsenosidimutans TaxID=2599293 RepID=A0A5B8M3T5_9MICO|nr:MFS transporter [Humibacter ginsenosidimutans]QDZ14821.1 MFS transporter [Humibacter ginsenosidimutans]
MSSSDAGAPGRAQGPASPPFPWVAMLALAAAAFLAVTSESLPTGLLPEIANGLHATTPQTGMLVSVYAFTVVIAATPLTALTRRVPRRLLVVIVIIVIGIGSLLMAIAPNYGVAVIARIIGGSAHGVFWAVTGAYAGRIVAPQQIARAVAITSGGVSIALILGSPLATILGHAAGWRVAFAVIGCLLVVGAFAIGAILPRSENPPLVTGAVPAVTGGIATVTGGITTVTSGDDAGGVRSARGMRGSDASIRPVMLICVLTGVITLGNFTLNAYVAPYIAEAMGLGTGAVGPLLSVGGVMGAVSVVLVGAWFGKKPIRSLVIGLVLTAAGVLLLALVPGMPPFAIAAFALWALAFGILPPLLQTEMLHATSSRFRDTASAIYTTAFNVGIGGGAVVGGAVYAAWGIGAVPWVAFGILIVSMVFFAVTVRSWSRPDGDRRVRRGAEPA